jgi:hypothetical protein
MGWLAADTGADIRNLGAGRPNYRSVAADLLMAAHGDSEWLARAMTQCRNKARERWYDLNIYQQKAGIIVELARVPRVEDRNYGLCPTCHQHPCECEEAPPAKPAPVKDYLKGLPVCPLCKQIPCECED